MKQLLTCLLICAQYYLAHAQNEYPTAVNSYVKLYGGGINLYSPDKTGGWARGLTFYLHNQPTERVLGLGIYGGETPNLFYMAYGESPWTNGEGLYILPNGNTGIGTISPDERLSVNGRIRAKEVKVEAVNWPDYVFKPDYRLTPLSELSDYIHKNGHLPGIPKATEVQTEGVELGDLNRRLLEKIEELTLHLIEKEEREQSMQAQLDRQAQLINEINSKLND